MKRSWMVAALATLLAGGSCLGDEQGLFYQPTVLGDVNHDMAIMQEETVILQRVPGIGKKTAERIMFQLRDKLDMTDMSTTTPFVSDVDTDVIDFLTGLGFSIVEAQAALQNIPREAKTVDERVQYALQYMDQRQ